MNRRLTGIFALIAVIIGIGLLIYFNNFRQADEEQVAFAPAMSTDESVPVPPAEGQEGEVAATSDSQTPAVEIPENALEATDANNAIDNALDAVNDMAEGVADAVDNVVEGAGDAAGTAGEVIAETVEDAGEAVGQTVEQIADGAGEMVEDGVQAASELASDVADGAGELVDGAEQTVAEAVSDVAEGVDQMADSTAETVADPTDDTAEVVGDVADAAGDVMDNAADTVADAADATVEALDEATSDAGEQVVAMADAADEVAGETSRSADQMVEATEGTVEEIAEDGGEGVADAADTTTEIAEDVTEDVAEAAGEVIDEVTDEVADTAEAMGETVEGTVEAGSDIAATMADDAEATLEPVVEQTAEIAGDTADRAGEAMEEVAEAVVEGTEDVADAAGEAMTEAEAPEMPEVAETDTEPLPGTSQPEIEVQPEIDVAALDAPEVEEPRFPAAPEMPIIVPSFDVVRVEPSGDVVVAGVAEPESLVELMDGVEAISSARAGPGGEWAMALDRPLEPGAHDLSIRTTSDSVVILSDQRIAVSVPERPTSEPLVVLNTPEAPSEVLQVPEATPTVEQVQPPEGVETAETDAEPAEPPTEPSETVVAAVDQPEDQALGTRDAGRPEDDAVAEAEDEPVEGPAEETEVAAAPQPEPEPEPEPIPEVRRAVSVSAVEADSAGALFVSGTAETGEPVRVYLDNQLIGESLPSENGTWFVEASREVPPGRYSVRADQVDATGGVLMRAEVPFERTVEVASLETVENTGAATGAQVSGELPQLRTVVIQRGDNLWRISRKIYGRGIRYSNIYEANRDQIRNPRWIYPGQVFVLPEGNTEWEQQ